MLSTTQYFVNNHAKGCTQIFCRIGLRFNDDLNIEKNRFCMEARKLCPPETSYTDHEVFTDIYSGFEACFEHISDNINITND